LTTLAPLSNLKHLLKLNASGNKLTQMLDFDPPAALEWVDLSDNQISKIDNVARNPYLRQLFLDKNCIQTIENLKQNTHLRVLSLNQNRI
jgi:Leucine-rich repeat (LRR) protein